MSKAPGDAIYADDWNELQRGVARNQIVPGGGGVLVTSGPGGTSIAGTQRRQFGTEPAVLAQAMNTGAANLPALGVCGIEGDVFVGTKGQMRRVLKVRVPTQTDVDRGAYAICAEPIKALQVGRVYVCGISLVKGTGFSGNIWRAALIPGETRVQESVNGSLQVLNIHAELGMVLVRFPFGGTGGGGGVLARTCSTANLTLAGLQTINGQAVTAGDLVLVKNQDDPIQNGVYVVSANAWTFHSQADVVFIGSGAGAGGWWYRGGDTYQPGGAYWG